MCGLTGIIDLKERRPIDRALLDRMNQTQVHRGPDAGGLHVEAGVGLGHRRLSIIDLSSGQQPLFNEDQSVVVVYNGEIYNFQELARELKALGHRFRTHCDTEVIVHAWEAWGEACVERFRGMFAFALWDRNRRVAFLARDRLGIKPLFYTLTGDGFLVFGSELKSLLVHPSVVRELDPRAVEEYFGYGYVPEPRTILKSVYKLSPGHVLSPVPGHALPTPRPYWDVPFAEARANAVDAGAELVERLREAVRIRMVADVPLGAFLSGGIDSGSVVAMMAGLQADPVNTCSIAFDDPGFDESNYAAAVADRYRTRHYVETVSSNDIGLIDRLAGLYDEPFADSSAMPTYRVCELARKHVTVALSGDGGDENLAGYRRYRWHLYEERMRSVLPYTLRRGLFGVLAAIYPKADWAPRVFRAKATFQALARNTLEGYFHSVSVVSDPARKAMYSRNFLKQLQGYRAVEVLGRHAENSPTDHPLSRIQYLDLKTYLAGDILTKVDRASMAHGLEVRVPILDHQLVEWMSSLPPDLKLRGKEGKYLFKRALEPYLPRDILYRPKMGFAVPLGSWFRGPLGDRARAMLLEPGFNDLGIFDTRYLQKLIDQHQAGRRDNSTQLWTVLMFHASQRRLLEG